ncbi:MAG: DUF192 domain-containing protein [Polyangiales bacterium]
MQTLTTFLAIALLAAPAACNSGSGAGSSSDDATQASTSHETAKQQSQPQQQLGTPQPKLPVGTVVLDVPPRAPLTVKAEVASTDVQRQMGLMWRTQMADDEGMIFLFEQEQPLSFWMRNTVLSLDLVFIDADWKVVGVVERATPFTDDPRGVPGLSQYVLEVNAGYAAKHGIGAGTEVRYYAPGVKPPALTPPPTLDASCGDKK